MLRKSYNVACRKVLTQQGNERIFRFVGCSSQNQPGKPGSASSRLNRTGSGWTCDRRVTGHAAFRHRVLSVGDRLAHKLSHRPSVDVKPWETDHGCFTEQTANVAYPDAATIRQNTGGLGGYLALLLRQLQRFQLS